MRERLRMTQRELDRLQILKRVVEKQITQVDAARILGVTDRHIRTLLRSLRNEGPQGIISKLVGRPSNRRIHEETKKAVIDRIREDYRGFGPTFIAEKLRERDGVDVSTQTIRNWMIQTGLWQPRKKRKRNLHPPRNRRPCFGELAQADGSIHRWFGADEPMANATVIVDDATSTLTALVFTPTECLNGYFRAFEMHFRSHGLPRAFYTDQWASFRKQKGVKPVQLRQALDLLDIELILASSPQAKGRVERANRTLQDRLVKEFALRGIKTIEEANAYAPEFIEEYNRKFSKKPMNATNVHRPLEGYDLERTLCRLESRSLDACGIFQYRNCHYQLQGGEEFGRLAKRKIEVRETKSGTLRFFLGNTEVQALRLDEIIDESLELNRKEVLMWKLDTLEDEEQAMVS